MNNQVIQEFVAQSIFRMEENTPRIEKCLEVLSEEQIWQKPNENSNSVGNLILHLCGNITQYIISSLGEKVDQRRRDEEFSTQGGLNKKDLLIKIQGVVDEAIKIMKELDPNDMMRIRSVQGFEFSAIGIVIHVVEHYSYHTGQIAFWTKLVKDQDLGFYAGQDLNQKNVN